MVKTKTKSTLGRHDLRGAYEPVSGYAVPPRSLHNSRTRLGFVAVPDAGHNPDGKARVRALARLDLLDQERRHGLIEEAAYLAGREFERVLERGARVGCGGQWRQGDRVDSATAHERALVVGAERAIEVNRYLEWVRRIVGEKGRHALSRVLRDRWTYKQVAAEQLKFGERGQREFALRFRVALELLAEAKAAKGPDRHERGSASGN